MADSNPGIQKTIDGYIDKIFLRYIPYSVKPNSITYIRFILTPIVYYFLIINRFDVALIIFIIAASTDFIDGAMARTRNQITDLGKIIDPIADKLLILSILLYIGFDYLIVQIFVVFIVFELIAVISGAFFSFAIGRPAGANLYGKIKMILQSFSVGLFILGILIKNNFLIDISKEILFLALVFAIMSGFDHAWTKLKRT